MTEEIILSPPRGAIAGIPSYEIGDILLSPRRKRIEITLMGPAGQLLLHTIVGERAKTLMRGLNKANLSNNSLYKRTINLFVQDGIIDGTIKGNPD